MNSNHEVVYRKTQPDLTIENVRSVRSNCYSETTYRVISSVKLDAADIDRLSKCGLLGFGQAYRTAPEATLTVQSPAVTRDRRTGEWLPDVPPVAYNGEPLTNTFAYDYFVYDVVRICDSGD